MLKKKKQSLKRKILSWFLILVGLLLLAFLVWLFPAIMESFTYPDAHIKKGDIHYLTSKIYNVRRTRNDQSGINLGCALQAPNEGDWGLVLKEKDFDAVQKAGFYHIRVPVQFLPHLTRRDNTYQLDEKFLLRLDWVIGNILDRDMIAIIDFHYVIPDAKLSFTSPREKMECEERFLAVWKLLAERYKDFPDTLYFELANEPHRPINPEVWNSFVQHALTAIRRTGGNNSKRMIIVGTNIRIGLLIHTWDQVNGIDQLTLPSVEDDPNIMVTFHYYNPYPFSHQGETYTPDLEFISGVWVGNKWTNTDNQISYVKKDFDRISRWARNNHRKVILGEFGVSIYADKDSQVNWTRLVREEAESRGMIWIFWQLYDISSLGGIYNQSDGFWRKEIIDALLPGEDWADNNSDAEPESVIRELIILLQDPEWKIRRKAAFSLRDIAPAGKSAIPVLISSLKDEEWQVRQASAQALSHFGLFSQPAIPELIEILKDPEWQVRNSAAEALAAIGETAYPAIPLLREALTDPEWQVRRRVAEALTSIGKASHQALPELMTMLHDEEWPVRESAIWAITTIAPENKEVQRALQTCSDDSEAIVRMATRQALTRINAHNK
ncbi:MAG: cellulase family glycosylhydrolase [Spirochaetales bacterium]|nr:cellulase family glycosylhydrolase [Spirochaetales bacterium]